jgi:outer membrane protein OmpA-like peptidoglycan-associated protein
VKEKGILFKREEGAMTRSVRGIVVKTTSICLLIAGVAFGGTPPQQGTTNSSAFVSDSVSRGQKVKTEGLVVSRQENIVTVRTEDSGNIAVALTDYTKVARPDGLLGKKQMPVTDLVPGLWIKVKGVGDSPGHVLADSIIFNPNDLRTAHAIQAGLTPLDTEVQAGKRQIETNVQNTHANQQQIQTSQQQIHANEQEIGDTKKRVSEIAEYDVKYTTSVYFPVSSATVSPQSANALMELVKNSAGLRGSFFEVKGFTDSSGTLAQNQQLSLRRAQNVITYLQTAGNIPLTHVFAPGGMGEARPTSSNETQHGRAENRRVEVKVLVSRGLAEP